MDSLLDLDRSELESHLFSQLSDLGRRDDDGSDDAVTEEDVDIERYQLENKRHNHQQQQRSNRQQLAGSSNKLVKNSHSNAAVRRSPTKTGRLVRSDLGSRGRPRKTHEVYIMFSIV